MLSLKLEPVFQFHVLQVAKLKNLEKEITVNNFQAWIINVSMIDASPNSIMNLIFICLAVARQSLQKFLNFLKQFTIHEPY